MTSTKLTEEPAKEDNYSVISRSRKTIIAEKTINIIRGLGIAEVVLGSISMLFALTSTIHTKVNVISQMAFSHHEYVPSLISAGIWCGVFVVISGVFAVLLDKNSEIRRIKLNMILCIVASIFQLFQIAVATVAANASSDRVVRMMSQVIKASGFASIALTVIHAAVCFVAEEKEIKLANNDEEKDGKVIKMDNNNFVRVCAVKRSGSNDVSVVAVTTGLPSNNFTTNSVQKSTNDITNIRAFGFSKILLGVFACLIGIISAIFAVIDDSPMPEMSMMPYLAIKEPDQDNLMVSNNSILHHLTAIFNITNKQADSDFNPEYASDVPFDMSSTMAKFSHGPGKAATGLWCGLIVITSGVLGILTNKNNIRTMLGKDRVMSIVAIFFVIVQFFMSIVTFEFHPWHGAYFVVAHINSCLEFLSMGTLVVCLLYSIHCFRASDIIFQTTQSMVVTDQNGKQCLELANGMTMPVHTITVTEDKNDNLKKENGKEHQELFPSDYN